MDPTHKLSPNTAKDIKQSTAHSNSHNESPNEASIFLADNENNPLRSNHQSKTRYDNTSNSGQDEMRNTLKKVPVKINAKNLPPAFGNFSKKAQNPKQLNSLDHSSSNSSKVPHKINNIENNLQAQEFKQICQLLSPLKREPEHKEEDNNKKRSSQNGKSGGSSSVGKKNPLEPIRNYMINYTKWCEDMKEAIDQEKINLIVTSNQPGDALGLKNYLINDVIKIEEMLTLNSFNGVKKMLHVPTLKLYVVKEEPITNKENRKNLKEWIAIWQNKFKNSKHHIKVVATFWNAPEGCVSIVMEMMNAGSLHDLLESVGTLPESSLKKLGKGLTQALADLHLNSSHSHGSLVPSQILFDKSGSFKLSLGLRSKVQQTQVASSLTRYNEKMSLYDPSLLLSPNVWLHGGAKKKLGEKESNIHQANDIFSLGLILLVASVGSLELLDISPGDIETLRNLYENYPIEPGDKKRPEACCLLHSENFLHHSKIPIKSETQTSSFKSKVSSNFLNQLNNLHSFLILSLNKRFSQSFLEFLCSCLRFDPRQRPRAEDLKKHPFLREEFNSAATSSSLLDKTYGALVTLEDLLKISINWTGSILPREYRGASEKQLERWCTNLSLALQSCEKWFEGELWEKFTKDLFKGDPNKDIYELATDLGLDTHYVWDKIKEAFLSVDFIGKRITK